MHESESRFEAHMHQQNSSRLQSGPALSVHVPKEYCDINRVSSGDLVGWRSLLGCTCVSLMAGSSGAGKSTVRTIVYTHSRDCIIACFVVFDLGF